MIRHGISRLRAHYYKFHIQTKAIVKVYQYGCETILNPGDAILIDSSCPFHLVFPTYFECYSIKIPRERLRPLLRDPAAAVTTPIVGRSSLAKAIKNYIHFLISATKKELDEKQMELYLDSLLGLIAVASSATNEGMELSRLSPLENKISQIKQYMLENLQDPNLNPAKVAEYFSISISYLHKLFAKEEETFGNFLRKHRLEYAALYLRNRLNDGHTITDLAYRLGFNDLSYFWRLFRERYGMTPRAFRNQAPDR